MKNFLLTALLFIGLNTAWADVIILRNGHSVTCIEVKRKAGRAYITHENGRVIIPQSMIARIETAGIVTSSIK